NTDSLTEMDPLGAIDSLFWIADHAKMFLSINHQKNVFTLAQVASFAGIGKPTVRMPCPAWNGYLEEVFVVTRSPRNRSLRRGLFYNFARARFHWRHFVDERAKV